MTSGTTAIVAEGGGQRGIFTAGVFDAFLSQSFNPFDIGIGVSAGSQNLLSYFLQQPGYARRAIMELTSRPGFLSPTRCMTSRSIVDLDGYFATTVSDPDYLLPYADIGKVRKRLVCVAADRETLQPVYLEPDSSNVMECVKASSAVPFLYRHGVTIDGCTLIDGGVADPLPLQHAYAMGARTIVLVRNSLAADANEPEAPWQKLLERVGRLRMHKRSPVQMLEHHRQALAATRQFLTTPPADVRLHVMAPATALKSQVFASQQEHLLEDYQQGVQQGEQAVAWLKRWLSSSDKMPGPIHGQQVAGSVAACKV